MKFPLSLTAALGAALLMAGCVVPVGRYHDGYRGDDRGDYRHDCGDRRDCDRHDHDHDGDHHN